MQKRNHSGCSDQRRACEFETGWPPDAECFEPLNPRPTRGKGFGFSSSPGTYPAKADAGIGGARAGGRPKSSNTNPWNLFQMRTEAPHVHALAKALYAVVRKVLPNTPDYKENLSHL